jgi:hypothetical protein
MTDFQFKTLLRMVKDMLVDAEKVLFWISIFLSARASALIRKIRANAPSPNKGKKIRHTADQFAEVHTSRAQDDVYGIAKFAF